MRSARPELPEFARFSSFAILLVVLGHSAPPRTPPDVVAAGFCLLTDIIYQFHMALFWWIAGYLFLYTNPPDRPLNYGDFVRKKAVRLLGPYVVISTIAFPVKALLSGFAVRKVSWDWTSYWVGLVYPWKNPIIFFWFLPTLFLVFLLAPALRALLFRRRWPVLAALTLMFLLLNLTQVTAFYDLLNYRGVLRSLLLFWLGMLACDYRSRLRWLEQGWMIPTALAVLLATYFLAKGDKLMLGGRLGFDWPGTTMALAGIAFGFALSCTLVHHGSRWLAWIDGWSTSIYLLSWFPQIFFKIVLFQYLQLWWPAAIAMAAGGLVLPLLVARWVRDHVPRAKLLVGQ